MPLKEIVAGEVKLPLTTLCDGASHFFLCVVIDGGKPKLCQVEIGQCSCRMIKREWSKPAIVWQGTTADCDGIFCRRS